MGRILKALGYGYDNTNTTAVAVKLSQEWTNRCHVLGYCANGWLNVFRPARFWLNLLAQLKISDWVDLCRFELICFVLILFLILVESICM